MSGDWQCGAPYGIGTHSGRQALVTVLVYGPYSNGETWASDHADSPLVDLRSAVHPMLTFWTQYQTESNSDGFNVQVSTDQGATWTVLSSVLPRYDQYLIQGEPAWSGGSLSQESQFTADLTPYAGAQVMVRFAFASDGSYNYRGVSIDDVQIAEDTTPPLHILTAALPDALLDGQYQSRLRFSGGDYTATWSVVPGGTNDTWAYVDTYGDVVGQPGQAGPVSLTVRISEPARPSNSDQVTYTLEVLDGGAPLYAQGFESACPSGWTLSGAWACTSSETAEGTEALLVPGADGMAWGAHAATSPAIDLSSASHPVLLAKRWLASMAGDGARLLVSTDGATFSELSTVAPAYDDTVLGEPAWSGDESLGGFHDVSADLSAYAGQTVYLRFEYASDGAGHYNSGGLGIDRVLVLDH